MTKKLSTPITDANGGMHSPVNYRKAMNMLKTHPYSIGLLFHIVLTGSEDRKVYRKAVELLCKELRAKGMPCRYKACYERDKWKRFHKHIFLLVDAKAVHPDSIIHYKQGDWFTEMLKELGLSFKIAEPKDPMHFVSGKQVNYAYVPKKASPKLDDCLIWISYLFKARSKEGVEGQIYTGSTNREPKQPVPVALPAPAEASSSASNMEAPSAPGRFSIRKAEQPNNAHGLAILLSKHTVAHRWKYASSNGQNVPAWRRGGPPNAQRPLYGPAQRQAGHYGHNRSRPTQADESSPYREPARLGI